MSKPDSGIFDGTYDKNNGQIFIDEELLSKPKYYSPDPLVGSLADSIERLLSGHIIMVNRKVYRSDGSTATDFDIELRSIIIEVKAGKGKGLLSQMKNIQKFTQKEVIAYCPNVRKTVLLESKKTSMKIFTSEGDLLIFLKERD